jgi:hypothetical protein
VVSAILARAFTAERQALDQVLDTSLRRLDAHDRGRDEFDIFLGMGLS